MITALQKFSGVEHVVPVGRAARGIAVALQVWAGGRRITVALSAAVCQDVIAAVQMAGCEPFFCDVTPATALVPESEWLRARAAGATAAILVHLYGNPADSAAARRCFPAPDCLLIDDAAQALGVHTATGLAGTEGDIGVVSFGATKHIEIGGGALLSRDAAFARECTRLLASLPVTPAAVRNTMQATFRERFYAARRALVETGRPDQFAGLLEGYAPLLQVAWQPEWSQEIAAAIQDYPARLARRIEKAGYWLEALADTGLVPVGMQAAAPARTVPWRFTCRLPGSDWTGQQALADALRHDGVHVSNWYLPGQWLLGAGRLPGVEQLAAEVFQFWLDDDTPPDTVRQQARLVQKHLCPAPQASNGTPTQR